MCQVWTNQEGCSILKIKSSDAFTSYDIYSACGIYYNPLISASNMESQQTVEYFFFQ